MPEQKSYEVMQTSWAQASPTYKSVALRIFNTLGARVNEKNRIKRLWCRYSLMLKENESEKGKENAFSILQILKRFHHLSMNKYIYEARTWFRGCKVVVVGRFLSHWYRTIILLWWFWLIRLHGNSCYLSRNCCFHEL